MLYYVPNLPGVWHIVQYWCSVQKVWLHGLTFYITLTSASFPVKNGGGNHYFRLNFYQISRFLSHFFHCDEYFSKFESTKLLYSLHGVNRNMCLLISTINYRYSYSQDYRKINTTFGCLSLFHPEENDLFHFSLKENCSWSTSDRKFYCYATH